MLTFAFLRRLVLLASWSWFPAPAGWGIGGPPGSPLGDARSFFFTSEMPGVEEAVAPVWATPWASEAPSPPAAMLEADAEEPGSDFLLDSIMEDDAGLSWEKNKHFEDLLCNPYPRLCSIWKMISKCEIHFHCELRVNISPILLYLLMNGSFWEGRCASLLTSIFSSHWSDNHEQCFFLYSFIFNSNSILT